MENKDEKITNFPVQEQTEETKTSGSINMGTMYEINKTLVAQEKILSKTKVRELKQKLSIWFSDYHNKYLMLLNNDEHDYTVFHLTDNHVEAAAACVECLCNRGSIISGEIQSDGNWEFWIRTSKNDNLVYYLFDYTSAVIEC